MSRRIEWTSEREREMAKEREGDATVVVGAGIRMKSEFWLVLVCVFSLG